MSYHFTNSIRASRVSTAALAVIVVSALNVASASAARGHEYGYAFGVNVNKTAIAEGRPAAERNVCPAPGHPGDVCQNGESGSAPGQMNDPAGLAINEATGVLYVADLGNKRIERFDTKTGAFLGSFDGGSTFEPAPGVSEATVEAGHGGGADEEPSGKFVEPIESLAVDNACYRHSPRLTGAACEAFDPSNGDVYVVENGKEGHRLVDKFSSTGAYVGQITEKTIGASSPQFLFDAVTVNQLGEVLVTTLDGGTFGANHIERFTNEVANKLVESRIIYVATSFSYPSRFIAGLALGPGEDFYAANTIAGGSGVSEFTSGENPYFFGSEKIGVVLVEEFSHPIPETAPPTLGLAVEPSTEDVYVDNGTEWVRYSSADKQLEALSVPGYGAGLAVGPVVNGGDTVYVADDVANDIRVFSPEGPGPPTLQAGSESVSEVTATSATFGAEVNPRSEEDEEETSYRFEYGPCETLLTCSSSPYTESTPAPEGRLAANYEPDTLGVHPQDLLPGTVYHMRIVAHNSHPGVTEGEELIFTTQGAGASVLPDDRHWELVSPPEKLGAAIFPQGVGMTQASANGDAITYLATGASESAPSGYSGTMQILSRRVSSSWESQDIATPHEAPAGGLLGVASEYLFFSEDLTSALVQPAGPLTAATSPQASAQTPYERSDFPPGDPSHPCTSSCYRPLVTGCPGGGEPCPGPIEEAADVPEGTKFSVEERGEPFFLGANPDASHVVFSEEAPLVEGAPKGSLYEWAAGRLALVSVLPNGKAAQVVETALGSYSGGRIARHAISADGGRVIFSEQRGEHHLYLRDMANEETIELDAPEAACVSKGKCKGEANPIFQTASTDDSRVFFTDSQPLTQSAGNSDLYECQIEEEEEGSPRCKLSDLTPEGGALGLVAGASEDGSSVYFTANGKLTTEQNAHGEEAVAGDCGGNTPIGAPESETAPQRCNLYVRSAGRIRLVAVLSGADFPDWSLQHGLGALADRVSPGGRYLAFMSRLPLSGYDNRDAVSGKPDEEVFLYDGAAGTLICASCNPTGGRPHGVQYKQIDTDHNSLAGGAEIWPKEAWIAANTPSWSTINSTQGFTLHQSRYLNDSGRLFFNSADALVPKDSNGVEDVYEYEPPGGSGAPATDTCTTTSPDYGPASQGCVSLISSGAAKQESAFLDASESGDDVFFLTGERLLPKQDVDNSLDVYDAHACTSSSPCLPEPGTPLPPCEGDACQSPVAPPNDQTPGSLTFQSPGNPLYSLPTSKPVSKQKVAKCPKGKTRNKHGKCLKKRKAKKSNRRARS